uniref:Uncharacterized protein n=1 Tax=Aegilops tauschii subsp. strangulata TaxID=200361 RepID=A0A453DVL5_AEGTS
PRRHRPPSRLRPAASSGSSEEAWRRRGLGRRIWGNRPSRLGKVTRGSGKSMVNCCCTSFWYVKIISKN